MTANYADFNNQHVIVTGAASGIGRSVALAFAKHGATVSAWDIDGEGLKQVCSNSPTLYPFVCDLADPDQIDATHAMVTSEHGEAAILVNNAGVDQRLPIAEYTTHHWRWMLSVNLDHQAQLSALVSVGMKKNKSGAIVNLSSTAWMKLAENLTAYHAAKAGVVGLTRGLARELGPYNVRVNAIAPGRVVTERIEKLVDQQWIDDTKKLQCLEHLISPDDIAETVLWLASDSARSVTGQTIVVDAGVV